MSDQLPYSGRIGIIQNEEGGAHKHKKRHHQILYYRLPRQLHNHFTNNALLKSKNFTQLVALGYVGSILMRAVKAICP
jgi:hypothetical protein